MSRRGHGARKREGWTSEGRGKVGRVDRHESGWTIRNCGHPTALWPWSAESPEGLQVVAWHGHGWRLLADARLDVEGLVDGRLVVSYAVPDGHRCPRAMASEHLVDLRAVRPELFDSSGKSLEVGLL